MQIIDALLNGFTLGGVYALVAMGLTLQYGVARIMNLSYGQFLVAAAMTSYWLFKAMSINPLLGLLLVVPASFGINWVLYQLLLHPLVKRARTEMSLEIDSILATFGLLFIVEGVMLLLFGGGYLTNSYLDSVYMVLGSPLGADRLLALVVAVLLGLYLLLHYMRPGTIIRAVAASPTSAQLVAINVRSVVAFTFALGAALVAASGVLVSLFFTFSATMGVVFTMKALIVVIMGGVGHLLGALVAGLLLGLAESFVAVYVDPGLTLAVTFALFMVVLLVRPSGIFGRAS